MTIGSEQENQQRQYNGHGALGSNASHQTGLSNMQQQQQHPQDEKSLIKKQIEDERQRIKQMEERQRRQIDEAREEHKRNMKQLEEKQHLKLQLYNEEKRRLIEDMNKTIELEKDKLGNLHKIDVGNRDLQYKRNLESQRKLYEDQHDNLKK